jgi:hypothetical protein
MTREEALQQLRELAKHDDMDIAHIKADDILLALINDPEITAAYKALETTDEGPGTFYE